MAAIAAPAVALAPVAGTLGVAGAFATAAVPSTILHTGSLWNEIDHDKKTQANAGVSFSVGFGMGLLDRLGVSGLVRPSQVFTKEGKDKVIETLMGRDNLTREAAELYVNRAGKDELVDTLSHLGNEAQSYLAQGQALKDTLTQLAISAGSEGATEAGQEVSKYLTAAAINGDKVDLEELKTIAIESAAAGGAVGASFSAAGSAYSAGKQAAVRAGFDLFDIDTLNDFERVNAELSERGEDYSIAEQIANTKQIKRDKYNGGADVDGTTLTSPPNTPLSLIHI